MRLALVMDSRFGDFSYEWSFRFKTFRQPFCFWQIKYSHLIFLSSFSKPTWRASDFSYNGLYKPPGTAAGLPAMPRRRANSIPSNALPTTIQNSRFLRHAFVRSRLARLGGAECEDLAVDGSWFHWA